MMPIDLRRPLHAALDAALVEIADGAQAQNRRPRLGGGRAILLGAGLAAAGRLALSSSGREMLEFLTERLPQGVLDGDEPDDDLDEEDDDLDEEDEPSAAEEDQPLPEDDDEPPAEDENEPPDEDENEPPDEDENEKQPPRRRTRSGSAKTTAGRR
jgi:hypothetical protein